MATQRIEDETRALWAELFGQAPAADEDPRALLQRLVESLPPVGYDRLHGQVLEHGGVICPTSSRARRIL